MVYIFPHHDNMNKPVRCGLFISTVILSWILQIHASTNNTSLQDQSISEASFQTVRAKRAVDCLEGPQGEECCIPGKDALPTYDHTDKNGNTCKCPYCRPPKYVGKPCVCIPGVLVGEVECIFPIKGKTYMLDMLNKCNNPFNCSTCPGNLIVVDECDLTKDTVCGCNEDNGFYQSGVSVCSPIPKCDSKFKPERYHPIDSEYTSFKCVPCGIHEDCANEVTTTPVLEITSTRLSTEYDSSTPAEKSKSPTNVTKTVHDISGSASGVYRILFITVASLFTIVVILLFTVCVWIWRDRRRNDRVIAANSRTIDFVNIPNDAYPGYRVTEV